MVDKQFIAKIGVFLLLGVNVGAYYVFWPSTGSDSKSEAKSATEEAGVARLLPAVQEKPPTPARPKNLSMDAAKDAIPLSIPSPARKSETEPSAEKAVIKLLEHIKKETEAGIKTPAIEIPMPDAGAERSGVPVKKAADAEKPISLPPLQFGPGDIPSLIAKDTQKPLRLPDTWTVQTEKVGMRIMITARLRQSEFEKRPVEIRIVCDRIETKGREPDTQGVPFTHGDMQAVGAVTFHGAGLKGVCQRMTLSLYETRLVFEEQVVLTQEAVAGSSLRGERIIWDLLASTEPSPNPIRAILGAPK